MYTCYIMIKNRYKNVYNEMVNQQVETSYNCSYRLSVLFICYDVTIVIECMSVIVKRQTTMSNISSI